VFSAAADVFEAVLRQGLESRRRVLRGRGALDPATSADELTAGLGAALVADARGRIGRASNRLDRVAWQRCPVDAGSPATLFPGECAAASDVLELAQCTDAAARCRGCRAVADMDGLELDCDGFDDGVPNVSCP
jgi:hypothetical protein